MLEHAAMIHDAYPTPQHPPESKIDPSRWIELPASPAHV